MLTFGELVTSAIRFYLNPGSETAYTDRALRERVAFAGVQVCQRIRQYAPHWWLHGDGTVVLSNGLGTLPADFGTFGTLGHPYLQAQPTLGPLSYAEPDLLELWLAQDASVTTTPSHYTLKSKTALGLAQIKTYPRSNATLDLKHYRRRMPELIDIPTAPTVAVNAAVGLLNGAYTYRVTFKHALGETEGGVVSAVVNPALNKVDLTDIAVPVGMASRVVTARGIYRTAAGGFQHKKVQDISDIVTTSLLLENVADGSLGADVPTPAQAVTGLEIFPEPFHETAILDGVVEILARKGGDKTEVTFSREWVRDVKRMWANEKQGQNTVRGFPAYGSGSSYASRRPRLMQ